MRDLKKKPDAAESDPKSPSNSDAIKPPTDRDNLPPKSGVDDPPPQSKLSKAASALSTAQQIQEEGVSGYAKQVAVDKAKSKAAQFLAAQLAKRGLSVAAGPVGWAILAVDLLRSKRVRSFLLWTGIILFLLSILPFILMLGFFAQKNHFGPDLRGGVERTDIANQSLPAQASNDKGQAVVTGLDTVDTSIAAAEKLLADNPTFPNNSEITQRLNSLKDLRRDTETKAYGASADQAKQLQLYRQILADLALLLDADAASKRDTLKKMLETSDGITLSGWHTCAPARDISNIAVTSKLLDTIIKIAGVAKANNTTATLTCLVTGYRDLTDGAYHGYPMCTNQDTSNPALTERQHNIGVHCNGRGVDFGGDWQALSATLKDKTSELGIEILLEANDHLHIEVLP